MKFVRLPLAAAAALCAMSFSAFAGPGHDHPAVQRALGHLKGGPASLAADVADAGDDFQPRDLVTDRNGHEHVRFDRTFRGLPVIGGDVVVHSDDKGRLKHFSRTLNGKFNLDTSASLNEDAALSYARSLFAGNVDGSPKAQLSVYARSGSPKLVYDITVQGTHNNGTPSSMHYIIDAHQLALVEKWDTVHTTDAVGTGKSLTLGTVTLHTDKQTSNYALRDLTRGSHYATNMANKTTGNGTLYTDLDNIWGNGATTDTATAAVDAVAGQNLTWDYYKRVHGRNGIANDGRGAFSRIHYGRNYVNAFWDDTCFCMTYGDGDGTTYLPLVALDVAGHEMTHGVTSRSANLTYSGESGGLNEATSDIMGTMVEYYANNANSPANYLIGERIYKAALGVAQPTKALRYMFKPSLDGSSPDCYTSTIGNLDVHYSSGVANHFYYLLAEGAVVPSNFTSKVTQASLVCNGNTAIKGIGRDAASKIWYRALTVYFTSSTKYAGARTGTLKAAADLYGTGSTQYNAVAAAWSAVSVN